MKKEVNGNNNEKKESFLERYKTDSKYKAKIQLLVGFIFLVLVVIYANSLDHVSYNSVSNNVINNKEESNNDLILNKIHDNNYSYDLEIIKAKDTTIEKYKYVGDVYNNKRMITKTNALNEESKYYIDNDKYYILNNDKYITVSDNKIYDFIAYPFLDINNIINYINVGTLDHKTEYNDGKVEIVYNVYLKNIVLNSNNEDFIIITLISDDTNNTLDISIDYTKYYNLYGIDKLDSVFVKYNLSSFGEIKEFVGITLQ